MKLNTYFIAAIICGSSLGVTQSVIANDLTSSPESTQHLTTPVLTANMNVIPYSYLLFGFTLYIDIDGATFNTTNANDFRNATTLSTPNRVTPYGATESSIRYRITALDDLRAVNSITLTIDQSVLSVPHPVSITIPVFHDIAPPDTPHEEANTIASLSVDSVDAADFLIPKGTVYTIILNDGEFVQGCSDVIKHSIMNTSNIRDMVTIWHKSSNEVQFVLSGSNHLPNSGNWNFELSPDTTTLNSTLYISTPINH
ncbi:hypothetical protein [Photobacterium toruni]|uniref:Uncharacterized protein n=1 Tax=Photobacterium toruni TaxID=1935446 RepID=A0A1T4UWI4_9GAMM|nr:hypothetical protein [Photobacterium toruni]SKA57052.1 hypothetical protein CZ814_03821 [Photobacterium toruni]